MTNRRTALPAVGILASVFFNHAVFAADSPETKAPENEIRSFSVEEKSPDTLLVETQDRDGVRRQRSVKLVSDQERMPEENERPRIVTVGLGGSVTFGESLSTANPNGASPDLNGAPVYTPELHLVLGDEFRKSPYKVNLSLGPSIIQGRIGTEEGQASGRNADFKANLDTKVYLAGDSIRPYGGFGASIDPYGDLRYLQAGVSLQLAAESKLDLGAIAGKSGTAGTVNGAEPFLAGPSLEYSSRILDSEVGLLVSLRALLGSKKAYGGELTGKVRYPIHLPFLADKDVKAELEGGVTLRTTQQEGRDAVKTGSFAIIPQGGAVMAF